MRILLMAAVLVPALGAMPGAAADAGVWPNLRGSQPPPVMRAVPRSPQASLVWAGHACWRGCAQDCGRHFRACLAAEPAEDCIARNNACDRFCQRECRSYGGPLLPLD